MILCLPCADKRNLRLELNTMHLGYCDDCKKFTAVSTPKINSQSGFFLPPFFLSPTGIMTIAIAVLAASNALFYHLWQGAKDDFNNYKVAVETQTKLLRAEADRAKAQSEKLSAEADANWTAARNSKPRVVRVLTDNCGAGTVRIVPPASGKPDAVPAQPEPSTVVDAAQCEEIANRAVIDAAHVAHLQQWIKDQHEVKR